MNGRFVKLCCPCSSSQHETYILIAAPFFLHCLINPQDYKPPGVANLPLT